MSKYVVVTKSDSCDMYSYIVESKERPTPDELELFLADNANDTFEDEVYEHVEMVIEIPDNVKPYSMTPYSTNKTK